AGVAAYQDDAQGRRQEGPQASSSRKGRRDMTSALLALVSLALLAAGVFALRVGEARSMNASLVHYRLRFPRGMDVGAVEAFLAGVTGLPRPWWRRWIGTPYVVVELRASARGIEHQLLVPRPWASVVENLIQAHLPGVRYADAAPDPLNARVASEYRLT